MPRSALVWPIAGCCAKNNATRHGNHVDVGGRERERYGMSISFGQVSERLLSGEELNWPRSGGARAGSIRLAKSGQRRLLSFLLAADSRQVSEGAGELFGGLITAWKDEGVDPMPEVSDTESNANEGPWYLHRIKTTNFGGLNTCGGPAFCLEVGGEDWCLEGSNGSGKTLLASAVIWTLTGYRVSENDGLRLEDGIRTPVYDDLGGKIGDWPPLATYPTRIEDLKGQTEVSVELVFLNPLREKAIASRTLVSAPGGSAEVNVDVDHRLTATPQLIEAGLLMPARLAHIGFGSKSASLYEAMKMLTGLDRLADIALGASAFTNRGRRFLKYARDRGIDRLENSYRTELGRARERARDTQVTIGGGLELGHEEVVEKLQSLSAIASTEAGELLALLKSDIAGDVDVSSIEGRKKLSRAVNSARDVVARKTKGVPLFAAWKALKDALSDETFACLPALLSEFEVRLNAALSWHAKQLAEKKIATKGVGVTFLCSA